MSHSTLLYSLTMSVDNIFQFDIIYIIFQNIDNDQVLLLLYNYEYQ